MQLRPTQWWIRNTFWSDTDGTACMELLLSTQGPKVRINSRRPSVPHLKPSRHIADSQWKILLRNFLQRTSGISFAENHTTFIHYIYHTKINYIYVILHGSVCALALQEWDPTWTQRYIYIYILWNKCDARTHGSSTRGAKNRAWKRTPSGSPWGQLCGILASNVGVVLSVWPHAVAKGSETNDFIVSGSLDVWLYPVLRRTSIYTYT